MDWKPLIKTFASILFGVALGFVATRGHFPHRPFPFGEGGPGGRGPDSRGRGAAFVEKFSKELSLSEDQRKQAEDIFAAKREKVEALHQEVFPRFEAVREETRQSIRAILNPEQQTKFDKMHEKRKARRKQFQERRRGQGREDFEDREIPPPPPGGPPIDGDDSEEQPPPPR